MKRKVATAIAGSVGLIVVCVGPSIASDAEPASLYSVVDEISGSGGSWDYAVIDEQAERLYLAQRGVTALDLNTGKLTTGLVAGKTTHGVTVLGNGLLAVDDAADKSVTLFDGASGKVATTIPTAQDNPVNGNHALDGLVREPKSGLVVAINGESGLLVLIDVAQAKVAGTVAIGGHPEFGAADGTGMLYVNVNVSKKRSEIVAVDIAARKVTMRMALKGCEEATGIAYDQADNLLISVCDNGVVKFTHADTGVQAASLSVGEGADAVMFDAQRRRAFVPSGDSGTLSVISVRSATDIKVVQTLPTQAGARLGAVDGRTGRVYLPTAKFGPPIPPVPYPSVVPGTFKILIIAPN